jgi:hypothetical protein
MKPAAVIGLLLLIVGVIALGYGGYVWVTGTEKVAEIGPVEIERQKDYAIHIAPIAGGLAIVGGLILLWRGGRS